MGGPLSCIIAFCLLIFWEAVYLTNMQKLKKHDWSTHLVYYHETGEVCRCCAESTREVCRCLRCRAENGLCAAVVNPVVAAHAGRPPVQVLQIRADEGSLAAPWVVHALPVA